MSQAWSTLVNAYLAELTSTRRLSAHTVGAYRRDLEGLAHSLSSTLPDDVDTSTLRRELARAHANGVSGRSLARRLSAWRSFFDWLGQNHSKPNPARGIRAPRSEKRLPSALSVDAAARLMENPMVSSTSKSSQSDSSPPALSPASSWRNVQDSALFELLYSSGLRLAECVGLNLDRLDLQQGLVTVLGKGNRTRTVPVGSAALRALEKWLDVRNQEGLGSEESAVFIGMRGRRISPRTVQERLAHLGQQLGLPQRIHPHMLRHSCASHVLQSSADLRAVQELLGHASIASTQIYTHLDFQSLAQVYDKAHPRAQRNAQGEKHEVSPSRSFRPKS